MAKEQIDAPPEGGTPETPELPPDPLLTDAERAGELAATSDAEGDLRAQLAEMKAELKKLKDKGIPSARPKPKVEKSKLNNEHLAERELRGYLKKGGYKKDGKTKIKGGFRKNLPEPKRQRALALLKKFFPGRKPTDGWDEDILLPGYSDVLKKL